jgi:hypothetical protein
MGRADRHAHREQGVALIWAILIMLIVLGTITVTVGMTLIRTDEVKDDANRTRSSLWVQSAADDIATRLQSREIGYDLWGGGPAPVGQDQVIVVPRPTTTAAGTNFPNGGTNVARRLQFTRGAKTYRGWYQVLPIPASAGMSPAAPASGTTPWVALLHRNPGAPGTQGEIELTVRVWEESRRAEPVVAKLIFRRASFSRFSILADDQLKLGGVGAVSPGGYIHTNNARCGTPCSIPPIIFSSGFNNGSVIKMTASKGILSGTPCGGGKCASNIGDVVEFGAASRAFDKTKLQAVTNTPPGVAFFQQGLTDNLNAMPVWVVDVAGSCAVDQVGVRQGSFPLRGDTGGVPQADDNKTLSVGPLQACLNVAEGGAALLFNGDVVVRGNRSSQRSVTIMAQRRIADDPLFVRLNVDNDLNNTLETTRVTAPAHVYLVQNSNQLGSTSPWAPLGVVAEGGVYLPSYAMRPGGPNYVMNIQNVSAMATGAEIAYGPSIIAIAADGSTQANGLGLPPSIATASPHFYGAGVSLNWRGSLASRRSITFRYGSAGSWVGYQTRSMSYPPELMWNPPQGYPTDRDWHLTDYKEFGS